MTEKTTRAGPSPLTQKPGSQSRSLVGNHTAVIRRQEPEAKVWPAQTNVRCRRSNMCNIGLYLLSTQVGR